MNAYTPDELILIQQFETSRLNSVGAAFQLARDEHLEAKAAFERWRDGSLGQAVVAARKSLAGWLGAGAVIGLSYLLNCVLIQEIIPDLTPGVQRLLGGSESFAKGLSTFMLSFILFAILFLIKRHSDTTDDFAILRPCLHLAVAKPVRRRIAIKLAVKFGYLLVLGISYSLLYRYIASGELLEQQATTSAHELNSAAEFTLTGSATASIKIDETIAGNRAASFMVYYGLEWALHTVILFVGLGRIFPENFSLALLSARRDESRHREANRRYQAAFAALRQLCHPRVPDDGVNPLRQEFHADLKAPPEPVPTHTQATFTTPAPVQANGTDYSFAVPHRG